MKNFIYCFVVVIFFSVLIILNENAGNYQQRLIDKFELVVFLKKDISAPEVIKEKLLKIENIKSIEFVSKESVKNKIPLKDEVVLSGENPFPDSFSILTNKITTKEIQLIAEKINQISAVDELRYDSKLVEIIDIISAIKVFSNWILRIIFIGIIIALIVEFFVYRTYIIEYFRQKHIAVDLIVALTGSVFAIFLVEILRYCIMSKVVMHISTTGALCSVFVGTIVGVIEILDDLGIVKNVKATNNHSVSLSETTN